MKFISSDGSKKRWYPKVARKAAEWASSLIRNQDATLVREVDFAASFDPES